MSAQREHPGPDARPDRSERQVEASRQLGVGESEEIRHLNQLALLAGQRIQRALNVAPLLADGGAQLGRLDRRRFRNGVVELRYRVAEIDGYRAGLNRCLCPECNAE